MTCWLLFIRAEATAQWIVEPLGDYCPGTVRRYVAALMNADVLTT